MHQQKFLKELFEIFKNAEYRAVTNASKTNTKLDECESEEEVNSKLDK